MLRREGRAAVGALLAGTVLVLMALLPAGAAAEWKPGPERYGVGVHKNETIRMADGTVLRANVYYPTDEGTGKPAAGRFPVLMVQTPYGKDYAGQLSGRPGMPEAATEIGPMPYFIKRGYIDVVADLRGTGASGGAFGLLDPVQGRDGAELVDWASKLPHSNGKVGTYGPSYMGYTQLMTAHNVGPHSPLKAMFPIVVGNDTYRDIAFQGGLQGFEFDAVIIALFGALNVSNPIGNISDLATLIQVEAQHVGSLLSYNAYQVANIETGGDQAYDGTYWKAREPRRWLQKIVRNRIPAFMVGGWYDLFQRGSPLDYSGLQNAFRHRPVSAPMKPGQKPTGRYQLLMGPWYHLTAGDGFSIYPLELRWFDHWLKGRNTGIDRVRSPLHLFETGADRWVDAKRYPLHSARRTREYPRATTFYLGSGPSHSNAVSANDGTLTTSKAGAGKAEDTIAFTGAASPCARQSDQWSGGAVAIALIAGHLPENPCAKDDRSIQTGPGALTYTTPPMKRSMTLAGPVGATIYANSNRPDTELVATLEDVAPDGTSRPLTAGALLGSMRALDRGRSWYSKNGRPILPYHPFTKASKRPVPTDGTVSRFDIEIFPTVGRIARGHHLRLTLTTADTPHLIPTPTQLPSLVGGVYGVQRNSAHASSLEVPLARPTHFRPCRVCRAAG